MKQATLNLDLNTKKTLKRECLEQMEQVVLWSALLELTAPYYPDGHTDRPTFSLSTMLRVYFMQQWFTISDPAMKEALFATPQCREIAKLPELSRLADESTILRFRHRLEKNKLSEQILTTVNEILTKRGLLLKTDTVVDVALITAPTCTKNKDKTRDPEMHSSKKGNQWYFGMKAHIGVDAEPGLIHTVRGTSGHVNDIAATNSLLHFEETLTFRGAGYQGLVKRDDAKEYVTRHVAIRPGMRRDFDKENEADAPIDQAEKLKPSVLAKVEHQSWVSKRQFGFVKKRYRGLKKNMAQLITLFNLWMMRGKLMEVGA